MSLSNATNTERQVRVRLNIYDLTEVSVPAHRFTVDLFLEVSWEDDLSHDEASDCSVERWELMFPYRGSSMGASADARRWTPRLEFSNVISLEDREEWMKVYTHRCSGTRDLLPHPVVCYRLRAKGTFKERFELHRFPFDSQDLQLQIVSKHEARSDGGEANKSRNAFALVKNEGKYEGVVPHDTFMLQDEYEMAEVFGCCTGLTRPKHSSSHVQYPVLSISLKITRLPQYYAFSIMLPMFLFVGLGFLALLLDTGSDRISIELTLLLACVAESAFLRDALPRCAYLTFLDKYVVEKPRWRRLPSISCARGVSRLGGC